MAAGFADPAAQFFQNHGGDIPPRAGGDNVARLRGAILAVTARLQNSFAGPQAVRHNLRP
jgi:hypothetical protein